MLTNVTRSPSSTANDISKSIRGFFVVNVNVILTHMTLSTSRHNYHVRETNTISMG